MRRDALRERGDLVSTAGRTLLGLEQGPANALVQAYVQHLSAVDDAGTPVYTRETVHQRVSALRWAVREARRRGIVAWNLDVMLPRPSKDASGRLVVKPGRDMRGPTPAELHAMLGVAKARARGRDGDGGRWLLILCLIAHETLREHEICAVDRDDVDLGKRTLTVVRKKAIVSEPIPLSTSTASALRRWLDRRGRKPGPLIWGSKVVGGRPVTVPGSRIGITGVYHVIREIGRACKVETSPHKVRHTAITLGQAVREQLGIPLHDAMRRAGHRSIEAHERYLDPDIDNVRRLSDGVAKALEQASS